MRPILIAAALLLAACTPTPPETTVAAATGAPTCHIPAVIEDVPVEVGRPDKVVADFTPDSQLLALAWQPEACASGAADTSDPSACASGLTWTLHGLWPNSADGRHPRYCRPSSPIDAATVRKNFCMTPSARLLQHEWAAHGVCAWETPEAYFDQARALWEGLTLPDPVALAGEGEAITAGALRDAFAAANPGLPREAVSIAVGSGNILREARLCHDLKFKPTACPSGGRGTPDPIMIRITRPQ